MHHTRDVSEIEAQYEDIPLGRWGQPEEVAYLVVFLSSDEAAWITGQVFPINGGHLIVGI